MQEVPCTPNPKLSTATPYDMSSSMQTLPSDAEQQEGETNPDLYQHFTKLVSSFPSSDGVDHVPLYHHPKGWNSSLVSMVASMVVDSCFAARPSDIFIATVPKSGTTWIKSLVYTTVHREQHPVDSVDHPLNSTGIHECIKFLEYQVYMRNKVPNLDKLPDPRMFATHVPFVSLPRSITASGCKVVYLCRDPKDHLISLWHFINALRVREGQTPLVLETSVEHFCNGLSPFGPYWDHVLGYWHAHLEHPDKVLFLRYEEMQREPAAHVRRLTEFLGYPFSAREEEDGMVNAVVKMCSFEHMTGLETTKRGKTQFVVGPVPNRDFFRRGVVGDWVNHLSPEMVKRIDAITEAKFKGSGLIF